MTGIKESEFITRIQLGIIKELYKNKKIESFNKTKMDEAIEIDIMI